ncbi:DUF2690 domain-containing protein [Streptomyces sp. NPDC020801]|uniref:helix-turn-helix domain-containing protein n=1 Tax=Streptomyces sp. NPDC020801 TaxID=3365093 RepID=UPI003792F156
MSRWRPLPGDLPPAVRRLVEELRTNKDHSKLTLTSLAGKTAYSRSSWHRYLNGRALSPWAAVEALGRFARADREFLRVLWESASSAWETGAPAGPAAPREDVPTTGEAAGQEPSNPEPRFPPHAARRALSWRLTVGAVAVACILLAVMLLLRPWNHGADDGDVPSGAPEGAPAWPWALNPSGELSTGAACKDRSCQGQDPYREGCDRDSSTIHALSGLGRTLRLEYSPACRAAWAEVDPARGTARLLVAAAGATTQAATPGAFRTAMVAADQHRARACVVIAGQQFGVTEHDSWFGPVSGDSTGSG